MAGPTGTVTDRSTDLGDTLVRELGAAAVSTELTHRTKVSSDWSRMSPILQEKVPPGRYVADLVVRPTQVEQVPTILRLAYEADVPVTPRGAGTGNYGQATPFDGGVMLDLRSLKQISVGEDTLTAGAGARMTATDAAARAAGRDVWIFPSTKGSTIGGFVGGGSAGTGTIEKGTTSDGFVQSLRVAPMDGSGSTFVVHGEDALPFIHTYGVTGVVTEVTVRTDPARHWVAVYASFGSYEEFVVVHRSLLDLPVLPRLASGDEPALVPSLPAPVELDPSRMSMRVIAEESTVAEITRRVRAAGGEVVAVLDSYAATDELSAMSYNHPVYHLQQARPEASYFHMETGGSAYWDAPDAVRAIYPGVHLHLELMRHHPLAMVVAPYVSEEHVLAGIPRFDAIGVGVHSPHQWFVDRHVDAAVSAAARTDPKGLLNPGKLVPGVAADTRPTIGVR